MNRLLKANQEVSLEPRGRSTRAGRPIRPARCIAPANATTRRILQKAAADKGLTIEAIDRVPAGDRATCRLRPVRVGLWDTYGGSMPSGWTRWLLEQFEFPFEVVFPKTLDAGNLASQFDVLIFVDGAIPMRDGAGGEGQPPAGEHSRGIPRLARQRVACRARCRSSAEFVEAGGTAARDRLLDRDRAITSACRSATRWSSAAPRATRRRCRPRSSSSPARSSRRASIRRIRSPTACRSASTSSSTTARRSGCSRTPRRRTWCRWRGSDRPTPLKSGWAWGQQYLDQTVQIVDAQVGKGRVLLFGPEIAWRAQPHGTFKFLFNGIYLP